ncbi:MAG: efflux RND transporter permease subunit, partial [Alphaproteobacteria bacterium]|nr:efflux RND transporter permease subunit [Alphaproteobacteria bacterium]
SLPAPPVYAKVNPADAPILTLALTSKALPLTQVEDLADRRVAQKISQLPGVGLVSINGGHIPAVRVRVNLQALAAYGLNIDDLRTTISNASSNAPKGSFDGAARAYTIDANDQLESAAAYRGIVIAYRNGAPVHLSDVASVEEGAQDSQLTSWMNTTPAILLNVQRQPGANVISVVDGIKRILPSIRADLPADVKLTVLTDRTGTIRASVADVEFELMLAVLLVVLVMYVFLHNARATFIPSLSVPLSIVGTFAAMYLLGYSLNNLSLMALTISTGFIVDDAIVMIENITRYLEAGETPLQAALKGSKEIGFTIVSLTISLIAVLIPLLFMQEVVGRLFREFAVTLAITILISAVVSLTLVPMLCSRLLRHKGQERAPGAFSALSQRYYDALVATYRRGLDWVLERQKLTMAVAAGTLAVTVLLYILIPKGFFPLQDTSLLQGITRASPSVSFADMAAHQEALARALLADPDVESLSSFIGVDGTNTTLNEGRLLVNLKPKDERSDTISAVQQRLAERAAKVAGITLALQPVQDLTVDATVSSAAYQFVLQSASAAELQAWLPKLIARLKQEPALAHVSTAALDQGEAVNVTVDRDTAARFGITAATIDNALYDAFGQRIVSTIFTQSSQYRVILDAGASFADPSVLLSRIYLPSAGGGQVPLSTIAHVGTERVALANTRLGQFPAAMVSFDTASGYSLGAAVKAVQAAEGEIGLPAGISTAFQGAALAFQNSATNEILLILAAIVVVYIVLGVLYESFIHPVTILSTLPSAGVGALIALIISGHELDIVSIIGIILLIGIVKKNAIMLIDFALEAERREGLSSREAIYQAALLRFRPILMTTVAALFGALPLMLGSGTGSELRHPLGIAIVGGLILSQLMTLFTTPVIYLYFGRWAEALQRWRAPEAVEAPAE